MSRPIIVLNAAWMTSEHEPPQAWPERWNEALIDRHTVRLLGKQGRFRPSVRLLQAGEEFLVAKDYRACLAPYRWTCGRWNLAREREAFSRLKGLRGIPRFEGMAGNWVLLMQWLPGNDIGKARKSVQTVEFYERLLALVVQMHARGVVHLDLRQRRNVLIGPGRRPVILDFGAALCLRPGSLLARWLGRIDVSGVLKYKQRANPGSLSGDEARALRRAARRRKFWPFG